MANHVEARDWRELCAAAVNEPDPDKLMALVAEINAVLEDREKKSLDYCRSGEDIGH